MRSSKLPIALVHHGVFTQVFTPFLNTCHASTSKERSFPCRQTASRPGFASPRLIRGAEPALRWLAGRGFLPKEKDKDPTRREAVEAIECREDGRPRRPSTAAEAVEAPARKPTDAKRSLADVLRPRLAADSAAVSFLRTARRTPQAPPPIATRRRYRSWSPASRNESPQVTCIHSPVPPQKGPQRAPRSPWLARGPARAAGHRGRGCETRILSRVAVEQRWEAA